MRRLIRFSSKFTTQTKRKTPIAHKPHLPSFSKMRLEPQSRPSVCLATSQRLMTIPPPQYLGFISLELPGFRHNGAAGSKYQVERQSASGESHCSDMACSLSSRVQTCGGFSDIPRAFRAVMQARTYALELLFRRFLVSKIRACLTVVPSIRRM